MDLNSEYEIEMWLGSEILVEIKIELINVINFIMCYLIENKCYVIGLDMVGERSVMFMFIDKEKWEIEISKGKLKEEIIVWIFMLDFFEKK